MGDERRIDALMVQVEAGRRAVRGDIFIDCSGDGDLAVKAGAPFELRRRARPPALYPSMMLLPQQHRSGKGEVKPGKPSRNWWRRRSPPARINSRAERQCSTDKVRRRMAT